MYGSTGKDLLCFLVVIAAIGGAVRFGAEHGIAWLRNHVTVGVH